MRGENYIFLKNKYLLLSLFIILITLITKTSCTPNTLWDIPIETIKQKIYNSDYSFIEDINFNNKNLSNVKVLGPGALYYFSIIFSRTGYPGIAEKMKVLSWQNEKNYWKDESGIVLMTQFLEEKEYKLLEAIALKYIKKTKEPENLLAAKKMYIKALYHQNKDKAVLDAIQRYFMEEEDNGEDPEIHLFKAVSACRLHKKGWQDLFTHLFLAFESSSVHNQAYQFLLLDNERFGSFNKGMQQFFVAKSLLGAGNFDLALPLVEYFLNIIDPEILSNSTIICELGLIYLSGEKYEQGVTYFTTLSEKLTGKVKLDALEMAGRIARKNKEYKKAAKYLDMVVQDARDPVQKDRAAWFYLACILEISPDRFADEIVLYAKQWDDPGYFDDIIQKGISIFIAEKKWETIQHLYTSFLPLASKTVINQLEFLVARLMMTGYLKEEGVSIHQKITHYLQKVSKGSDSDYYSFFASSLLKQEPLFLSTFPDGNPADTKPADTKPVDINPAAGLNRKVLTPLEEFIVGFFDFGLIEDGYSMLVKYRESISSQVILYIVKRLSESGYFKESIWLMNTYKARKYYLLTKEEMMYAYPIAYSTIIEKNAQKRNFSPPFFYALVREEGAFDAENISVAGAAGLSQLMPETANDIAGWLRLDEYDLSDPEINILMGAYYYSRLLRVLENNIPKTLIAYNAGLGNLRRWEKEYRDLPLDLFVEAIPYRETRGYIKKIIVSTCIYSYLYYKMPSSEVFAMFFPDMF